MRTEERIEKYLGEKGPDIFERDFYSIEDNVDKASKAYRNNDIAGFKKFLKNSIKYINLVEKKYG